MDENCKKSATNVQQKDTTCFWFTNVYAHDDQGVPVAICRAL